MLKHSKIYIIFNHLIAESIQNVENAEKKLIKKNYINLSIDWLKRR